jgi:hypothetical protein
MRSLLPWVGISGDDPGDWIAAVNRFRKTVLWDLLVNGFDVVSRRTG